MTQAVRHIIAQIDSLSNDERAELAYEFLGSFEADPEVTCAWEEEVKRRFDEVRTNKVRGIPANELFAELRQRSSK